MKTTMRTYPFGLIYWDINAGGGWAWRCERDSGTEQESDAVPGDLPEDATIVEVLEAIGSDLPADLEGADWTRYEHSGGGWEGRY